MIARSLLLLALPLLSAAVPTCKDLTITVDASADASKITLPSISSVEDLANQLNDILTSLLADAGRVYPIVQVSGTYHISGRLCEPEVKNVNSDTVQILGHGATYTKTYWNGLDLPASQAEPYSWVQYASKAGYWTLAIDRIGSGKSDHPDPLLTVQVNLDAETIIEIIKKLRAGEVGDKTFDKVVYVGHSLGSVVGSVISQRLPKHPGTELDALILTGWSGTIVENFAKILTTGILPAPLADPLRFLTRNILYLALSIKEGERGVFYSADGDFDPKIHDLEWNTRDVVSIGELVSVFAGAAESPSYKGPVHISIGDADTIFCNNGGKCSDGVNNTPGNSANDFPNSSNFTYFITPNSGHDINFHYTARQSFQAAHEFLQFNLEH